MIRSYSCSSRQSHLQIIAGVMVFSLGCVSSSRAAPVNSPNVLAVKGDIVQPRSWTLAQLQKLAPVQTIRTTLKGKSYTARGISLWSLLQTLERKPAPKTKHPEARFVVLARGQDGYTATFSWPELMPDTGNKTVFLIWEVAGKPLPAKEGALRLVVPGDKKPMRWVYNLTSLEIYDAQRLMARESRQDTPR